MKSAISLILALMTISAFSNAAPTQFSDLDCAVAASSLQATEVLDLWPGAAPGSEDWKQEEVTHDMGLGGPPNVIVRNVLRPTLSVYLPDPAKANGTAVVVAPGGGFMMLSIENEGHKVARCLASKGVAAMVLKYRLVETPGPAEEFRKALLQLVTQLSADQQEGSGLFDHPEFAAVVQLGVEDGIQALKLVRQNAKEWKINPERVGLIGFSAGARVTAGAIVSAEAAEGPDFAGLIYGGLFGDAATLPENPPPVFAVVAADDVLALGTTQDFVHALQDAGEKPEFHLYSSGGHGFGMNKQNKTSDQWMKSWLRWMEEKGLLQRDDA